MATAVITTESPHRYSLIDLDGPLRRTVVLWARDIYGPAEWVWRAVTYLRVPAMRISAAD